MEKGSGYLRTKGRYVKGEAVREGLPENEIRRGKEEQEQEDVEEGGGITIESGKIVIEGRE